MRTIYVDPIDGYKCYTTEREGLLAIETEAFDGYCQEFIEGCRLVPDGVEWQREDGKIFIGEMKTMWRPSGELEKAQLEYLKTELADADAALREVGVFWNET